MTSLLSPSRALSYQLASRISLLGASRKSRVKSWSRVTFKNESVGCLSSLLQFDASTPILSQLLTRPYATKPGKPKAHTGRVAASKRRPAAARSDVAAGVPQKAPAREAATRKKAAAKKPKRKTKSKAKSRSKAKSKAKSKSKAKPKPKVPTPKQRAAKAKKDANKKRSDLKQQALLNPPKLLPFRAYGVFLNESSRKGTSAPQQAKAISTNFKSLSPEELERLNRIANENKAKNDAAFAKWLGQYTPTEIKAANAARNRLQRLAKEAGSKKSYFPIKDERTVKRPRSPYLFFLMDRFASGDMMNMQVPDCGPLIAREWKALSAAEKKPYMDKGSEDRARYFKEYTAVHGTAPAHMDMKPT